MTTSKEATEMKDRIFELLKDWTTEDVIALLSVMQHIKCTEAFCNRTIRGSE